MPTSRPEGSPRRERHPPAWLVERLAFDPDRADSAARAHADACPGCRRAVEQLLRERSAFLAGHPVRPFVAAVASRAACRPAHRGGRWGGWGLAVAAAAAAALAVHVREPEPRGEVAFKGGGGAVLRVFVSRDGDAARPLRAGDPLRPRDVVRFGVVAPAGGHVLVASVDEEGRVDRYFPQGELAFELARGADLRILPGSVVLDDVQGREWVVLLVARRPLERRAVEDALRRAWRSRRGEELGPVALDAAVCVVQVTKVAP